MVLAKYTWGKDGGDGGTLFVHLAMIALISL